MKIKSLLTIILILLFSELSAQKANLKDRIDEVENNLIPYVPIKDFEGWNILDRMQYYNVKGLSIAVIKDYKVDWAKGYGLADTIKKIPVTTQTLFSAGSISKFVAAVTALDLVENKQLSLDLPINNYLKSWKITDNDFTQKTPVTLRMLLSHTAGTSQSSYFGFTPDKKLPSILEILNGEPVSESRKVVVNSAPSTEFRYSGGGSMIAQMAMMDVSGQSFSALTQQLIFDQLGMKNSTFEQPVPTKYDNQTSWAYSSASWFKGMPYVYPQQAAAGLYTTPTDLAHFFIDVQKSYIGKGNILDQNTARQMLTPQIKVSDGSYKEEIGIGPFLLQRTDNNDEDGKYFEFTGVNAGFLAYGIASVTNGNGVIVMLNSGDDVNGIGKEIRRAVAKAYQWYQFLPEEIQPIQLSNDALDKLTGRFRKSANEVVYIKREKNYLVENINDGPTIYCFPIAKNTIVFTDYNVKGTFETGENGFAKSLKSEWQEFAMPKMLDDEFTPNEYLKAKNYVKAKKGFTAMKMNEYQITYLAYDLLNKKNNDLEAVKMVLETAIEQHPNSAIVHSRWADYYFYLNDIQNAIAYYEKALALDPSDDSTRKRLEEIKK